jgi:hypothetical protein
MAASSSGDWQRALVDPVARGWDALVGPVARGWDGSEEAYNFI